MKGIFSWITTVSLRFRAVTLAAMVVISVLGVIAITQLRQELIPAVEFPQTIILSQASGMTSEQVLNVLTTRIENALQEIPQIVNIESTTTGSFGAVVTARNNFGDNQARLQQTIREALDQIWLPTRRIAPSANEDPAAFAARLMADLTPDVLIYLEERDANFLFQLTPEVWSSLSDDTLRTVLAYLAAKEQESADQGNALRRLIDQEILPALVNLDVVATVNVSGGQQLPDDLQTAEEAPSAPAERRSQLLQLTPEVWAIVSERLGLGALTPETAEALAGEPFAIPDGIPALPDSWRTDRFETAADLREMRTLTRTVGSVFNNFITSGSIVGALGQTDDLTPEVIEQMLAIEPGMVNYFKAEHLVAMSDEVFAALPDDFIASLDGFTRDELAARALAESITGQDATLPPVDLPQPWRISPPQLITFSFDDLPLATFSVSGNGVIAAEAAESTQTPPVEQEPQPVTQPEAAPSTPAATTPPREIPEGPSLPLFYNLLGGFIGVELNTADDLIDLQLPENVSAQFGGAGSLSAADLFNFLMLLGNPDALPPGVSMPPIPLDPAVLIGGLSPEVIAFLAENDPTFVPSLQASVFNVFSDRVLSLPQIAPPLDSAWNALSSQPQFSQQPLRNAADVIAIGNGSASNVLNTINSAIPSRFEGYEVRLFSSLSPAVVRYFALQQPDFYETLDEDVVTKFAPEVLAALPESYIASLDPDVAASLAAIAAGEAPSAMDELAALYVTNVPPADPNAPVLNADWQFIGDFIGVELNSADDFFRFFPDVPNFLNSFFDSAQGAAFAPNLFGNLSAEALDYMVGRQPDLLTRLRIEALQLLSPEVVSGLPQSVQDRLTTGEEPFVPTNAVTRTNGNSSFNVTIFKARDANTVEAYHIVEDALHRIDEANENIVINVAFEQASFIEESIGGVAREGGLGAVFAVVVILIFLSSGVWSRRPRTIVGAVLIVFFLAVLALLVGLNSGATGGDLSLAWDQTDVVVRFLLIAGMIVGALIILFPGRLPRPAWRSTIVTAVSIPLSILMAMALMRWLPPAVNSALAPAAEGSPFLTFILRLFPASLTINIMTLSGLTVAIGRVVDDSIVVLENIFREVQAGGDKREAIIRGTRDVSVAIFAATVITVVVFLPLGLTGGIIGEFFLPFGLAVTYSLMASFFVAITVVPVMAYLMLNKNEIGEEERGILERIYVPALHWALGRPANRAIVLAIAFASLILAGVLFAGRPQAFLPAFGEPQIGVSVELPSGTRITETNALVSEFEAFVRNELPADEIGNIQVTIGNSGLDFQTLLLGNRSVSENIANITIGVEDPGRLDTFTAEVRAGAERIFGEGNVTVSGASLSEQGFGGFALELSGPQEDLIALNQRVIDTLNAVPGLANVSSNLAGLGAPGGENSPPTYIRIDGQTAVRFTGELETENTLGVTNAAKEALLALPDLPPTVTVSEGFETRLQTEGFANLFVAMGIAIAIVIVILVITFGSLVHWLDIILSIIVAPVGAAILLTLTNRVLGISALIGMLMLIGIVVTNAVVLIDRVQSNQRERRMNVRDSLLEAGERRLRPIVMTALATICALLPLAIGLSRGAIIASELGTVVIGGLFSSTLLTLIVVPVAYMLLSPLHKALLRLIGRKD
ncbi:efflux RND transporter permease subunit [Anaerolineae bacterium CFX9]|nr:efflux RND transporter permease subunit [Anaerolineae bacterium CFX9]